MLFAANETRDGAIHEEIDVNTPESSDVKMHCTSHTRTGPPTGRALIRRTATACASTALFNLEPKSTALHARMIADNDCSGQSRTKWDSICLLKQKYGRTTILQRT
jgi:hypothetical protein